MPLTATMLLFHFYRHSFAFAKMNTEEDPYIGYIFSIWLSV